MKRYYKPRDAADMLGISSAFLRKAAEAGALPEGSVLCTPGNHRSYDVDAIRDWMQDNYNRLARRKRGVLEG
ncbi:MAG: hypothetical protein LIQ30_06855 [Planctomycetes bacterium]|nr:hypothetical protein [Planctomycetota bacterium]MCD7897475.1 hypothetical protein [Planctomycetaceae bacterium]